MKTIWAVLAWALAVLALGCGGGAAAPKASGVIPESGSTSHVESSHSLFEKSFEQNVLLAEVLLESGLNGAIALYDAATDQLLCSGKGACDVPLIPASTFKVPHTLIGLELGELESAEHSFKWDGQDYSIVAWNQDHTLRSAMEVSCVPCFQQLARKIGEERMSRALRDLDYGNATLGGPIDEFWLEGGGLRITQRGQLEFLHRLETRTLPFRGEVMETTIDVIPKAVGEGTIVRGKTGMILEPGVGWYVGWLEWEKGTTFFASALYGENDVEKMREARRPVTLEALRRFTKIAALK